jgi:hypothetical protein
MKTEATAAPRQMQMQFSIRSLLFRLRQDFKSMLVATTADDDDQVERGGTATMLGKRQRERAVWCDAFLNLTHPPHEEKVCQKNSKTG